jgi:hypothetical protein
VFALAGCPPPTIHTTEVATRSLVSRVVISIVYRKDAQSTRKQALNRRKRPVAIGSIKTSNGNR